MKCTAPEAKFKFLILPTPRGYIKFEKLHFMIIELKQKLYQLGHTTSEVEQYIK